MNKTANDTKFIVDFQGQNVPQGPRGATGALFSTVVFLYAGD